MNYLKAVGLVVLLLILVYILGPAPKKLKLTITPIENNSKLENIELKISEKEKNEPNIRIGNEAKIIWTDSLTKQKTPYSIVYLHGFSASQAEGFPVHQNIAKRYGCNLYLPRLYKHGLTSKEPLLEFTAEGLVESAREAIAIGKQLGDKVILLSTSTGSTLSLLLAGEDKDIACLLLYSPNIDLYDTKSFLLVKPWGLQIARSVIGDKYYTFEAPTEAKKYWTTTYRIEALIALKNLINASMNDSTFKKVKQPVFVGYYYKDKQHQDNVVSIPKMKEMYCQLGTPLNSKRMVNFPEAGYHVIGSSYWNKNTQPIEDSTCNFLEEVLLIRNK